MTSGNRGMRELAKQALERYPQAWGRSREKVLQRIAQSSAIPAERRGHLVFCVLFAGPSPIILCLPWSLLFVPRMGKATGDRGVSPRDPLAAAGEAMVGWEGSMEVD